MGRRAHAAPCGGEARGGDGIPGAGHRVCLRRRGRLLAAHTAGRTFQRALDGRILEKLPSHKLLKGPWERRCRWHLSRLRVMPDSPCERWARAERVVPLAPDELVAQDRLLAAALRRPGGPHVASYNI